MRTGRLSACGGVLIAIWAGPSRRPSTPFIFLCLWGSFDRNVSGRVKTLSKKVYLVFRPR